MNFAKNRAEILKSLLVQTCFGIVIFASGHGADETSIIGTGARIATIEETFTRYAHHRFLDRFVRNYTNYIYRVITIGQERKMRVKYFAGNLPRSIAMAYRIKKDLKDISL